MTDKNSVELLPQTKPTLTNGKGATGSSLAVPGNNKPVVRQQQYVPHFDRPVVLQQSPRWSRLIIWTILGITALVSSWAFFYRIEEAIPAQGQLEPKGAVKDIQPPVTGVVTEILVKDGQRVNKGDVLLRLDPKATQSELASSRRIRQNLILENQFYKNQLAGLTDGAIPAGLPPRVTTLIRNRRALLSENQLYRAQLGGVSSGVGLSPEQQARLQAGIIQGQSSVQAAAAQVARLRDRRSQVSSQIKQNQIQFASAQQTLALNQSILGDLQEAFENGAVARLQYSQQKDRVQTSQAEVDRLREEAVQLQEQKAETEKEIYAAQEQLKVQQATNQTGLHDRIADNTKRIGDINSRLGEIDSELKKRIVDNDKQIAEIDNRLTQADLTQRYQVIKSPVDGVVFDLKPTSSGYVVNASEPILKIVPADSLQAKIYITNKDIGFVKKNMNNPETTAARASDFKAEELCPDDQLPVDVRIDSFPFSEFGDVKGCLVKVGSDALPPDQATGRNFYSFPAEISLKSQSLNRNNIDLPLQSGMSVSVNIKLRKRPVISIFTDQFFRQADKAKTFR